MDFGQWNWERTGHREERLHISLGTFCRSGDTSVLRRLWQVKFIETSISERGGFLQGETDWLLLLVSLRVFLPPCKCTQSCSSHQAELQIHPLFCIPTHFHLNSRLHQGSPLFLLQPANGSPSLYYYLPWIHLPHLPPPLPLIFVLIIAFSSWDSIQAGLCILW